MPQYSHYAIALDLMSIVQHPLAHLQLCNILQHHVHVVVEPIERSRKFCTAFQILIYVFEGHSHQGKTLNLPMDPGNVPLSPFMTTQILLPTHLSINSGSRQNGGHFLNDSLT